MKIRNLVAILVGVMLLGAGCFSVGSKKEAVHPPSNPYDQETGHFAGFEWAEQTGGGCDGNSVSFNEGCEEYYDQLSKYEDSK